MVKLSRVFLTAVFAVGMSLGFSARAEILVYDGFPTGSGAYSTTDKTKLSSQGAGNFTTNSIFGFDPKNWQNSTGVIYSFTSGLSLPDGFDALPSAEYVGAGSVGANDSGADGERGQYKQLSSDVVSAMKSAKELHFRFLISADQKVLNALTVNSTAGNVPEKSAYAAGICLSTSMAYGSVRNSNRSTARTLGFAIRRVGVDGGGAVAANLSLLLLGTEDAALAGQASGNVRIYDLITSIDPTKTYICYAKVVVGGEPSDPEQISVMAQPVDEYDPAAAFADIGENGVVTANLIDNTGTGAPNYINFAAGSYKTNGGYFKVDEFALATSADDIMHLGIPGAPTVQNAALTGSNGSYSLSATVTKAAATDAGALVQASDESVKFSAGEVAVDGNFVQPFTTASLSADKTYEVAAYAKNDAAAVTNAVGTVYTGILTLEKVKDADEYKCVPGEVTVSRATADPYPLTVNYTFSSATEGATAGKTWVAPEPVVIPADETSATIKLTPIVDADIGEDITVTLSLTAGNYPAVAQTVDLTLANLVAPEGYNTWVATASGKASDAANWSLGRVPISTDKILFDGDFSNADCEWDADAEDGPSATIAELKMESGYSGTVTVLTTFPEVAGSSFHVLTVSGDAILDGGTLTHARHTSSHQADYYRLRMDVDGNLSVASGATVSARGKGSFYGRKNLIGAYGGSYDGARAWGSLTEPFEVGSSGIAASEAAWAGGAIWIEVSGTATVNGAICANGIKGQSGDSYAGSGGAVYLKTASLTGVGMISADSEMTDRSSNTRSAAGGRVSVLLTGSELADFPAANITAYAANPSYAHVGGCGTVLVRSPEKPNGVLYLSDRNTRFDSAYGYRPTTQQMTDIPANTTWRLDGIVFGYGATLRVASGTTLELPNGLDSVSGGASDASSGMLIDGGSLVIPEGNQTISGGWVFQPNEEFTIKGDLALSDGGKVGTMFIWSENTNALRRCRLTVAGDMTVDAGASIYAVNGGYVKSDKNTPANGAISVYGGQCGFQTGNMSYGSVFNPVEAGGFGVAMAYHPGSGAAILKVDGTLTLNGSANADAKYLKGDNRPGAAGTINITAGRLEGSGSVSASGAERAYWYADRNKCGCSAGGRIAIRLTEAGATFSEAWISKINAKGKTYTGKKESAEETVANSSSAGTVYLQTGNEAEGAGTIYVRNDGNVANAAYTPLPSTRFGGENDDYRKSSMVVDGASVVKLFDSLKLSALTLAADSRLDLNGNTLTVKRAKFGDARVSPGVYAADDYPDFLSGEGSIVVLGGGLTILFR